MDADQGALPEAAAPAPRTLHLGATLRAAREAVGIEIEQAAELLRIEPRFLAAIEDERFEAIGPPVFVRGYVKHYSDLLGLDPEPMLDALRERIGRVEPLLEGRRSAEEEDKPPGLMPFVVGAVVIIVAAIAWWQLGSDRATPAGESLPAESAQAGSAPAEVGAARSALGSVGARRAAAPGPADVTGAREAESADLVGAREPESVDLIRARGPESADVIGAREPESPEVVGAREPESIGIASGDAPFTARSVTSTADTAADVVAAGGDAMAAAAGRNAAQLELEFFFHSESWAEITAADGGRLFYGLAQAGGTERILADQEVSVLLGNADAVTLHINGEAFAYPADSRRGALARFTLSPPED